MYLLKLLGIKGQLYHKLNSSIRLQNQITLRGQETDNLNNSTSHYLQQCRYISLHYQTVLWMKTLSTHSVSVHIYYSTSLIKCSIIIYCTDTCSYTVKEYKYCSSKVYTFLKVVLNSSASYLRPYWTCYYTQYNTFLKL